MRRRDLLTAVGASLVTAGCAGRSTDDQGTTEAGDTTPTRTADTAGAVGDDDGSLSFAEQGRPPTICEEDLRPDGIEAIVDPAFGPPEAWPDDPDGYRPLTDRKTVIGLTHDGEARAYPLALLNVHEVVNDTFGDPVVVTYCPICRSGMVAERRVDGEAAAFDASGLLWVPPRIYTAAAEKEGRVFSDREEGVGNNGNLVMYDSETGSYWSQMLGRAICGPAAGERLEIRASSVATWGEWRADHPDTSVLLPPPASGTVDPPV